MQVGKGIWSGVRRAESRQRACPAHGRVKNTLAGNPCNPFCSIRPGIIHYSYQDQVKHMYQASKCFGRAARGEAAFCADKSNGEPTGDIIREAGPCSLPRLSECILSTADGGPCSAGQFAFPRMKRPGPSNACSHLAFPCLFLDLQHGYVVLICTQHYAPSPFFKDCTPNHSPNHHSPLMLSSSLPRHRRPAQPVTELTPSVLVLTARAHRDGHVIDRHHSCVGSQVWWRRWLRPVLIMAERKNKCWSPRPRMVSRPTSCHIWPEGRQPRRAPRSNDPVAPWAEEQERKGPFESMAVWRCGSPRGVCI